MKLHTDHFEASENGKNRVLVISENEETRSSQEDWDIYLFGSPKSHYEYFDQHIRHEHEDPKVIAAGDLIPRHALKDSPQSIFIHSGSLDNAGLSKEGLGISKNNFEAWRVRIEKAINERINQIKARIKAVAEAEDKAEQPQK